ncbi:MAG: penicillin acylase family protein [Spirosomataceae bacterium]
MRYLFVAYLWAACVGAFAQINPDAIQIARDRWGVPHIFAKTDPEVAYGLAWAHAEDDFGTMQLTILAGKQMLGRHLGKDGAAIDYVVALIRARELAEARYETDLSPDYRALLSGYVAGINAYAAAHPKEVLIKEAFPITEIDATTAAILSISTFCGLDNALKTIFADKMPLAEFKSGGSNAFAFNSKKTKDGNVYLNINSHQPLEGPQSWYEAHLMSEQGWNCLGGLFPGGATIFHGVNEHLGWAHTVNYHDKMDVYQLELNPENKNLYRFDNEWLTLEEKEVTLTVKVGFMVKVKRKIWWSKYGPTVVTDKGMAFALRYPVLFEIRGMEQWYRMNKARNFTEFKKALGMTAIPGFNIVYADKYDTIFYVSNGKIPLRNPAFDWLKTLPGNTSQTLWTSFHPFQDLPQLLNPSSGYVFNTNHTPFNASAANDNLNPEQFDKTMGIERWDNNRSKRFMELVGTYDKLSYEDFKTIKFDQKLPSALAYFNDPAELFRLNPASYPDIEDVIKKIQTWDKRANADNPNAAVFLLFYQVIKDRNQRLDLGNHALTTDECVEALRSVKEHLLKHFKTVDITLGDLQKLVRGDKELPMSGIPDVLAAMASDNHKNGKLKATAGESYIELVKFTKNGLPEIESISPYGASNHPESPHYADQMELFTQKKTKKMSLDKQTVLKEAERVYAPK